MPQNSEIQSTFSAKPLLAKLVLSLGFALLFVLLVYHRYAGLNVLLLTLAVQVGIHFTGNVIRPSSAYIGAHFLCLAVALVVAIYGYGVFVLPMCITWTVIKYYTGGNRRHIAFYAFVLGNLNLLENLITLNLVNKAHPRVQARAGLIKRVFNYAAAFAVLLVFFVLYYYASAGFAQNMGNMLDNIGTLFKVENLVPVMLFILGLFIAMLYFKNKDAYKLSQNVDTAASFITNRFLGNYLQGLLMGNVVNFMLYGLIALATFAAFSDAGLIINTYFLGDVVKAAAASKLVHQNVASLFLVAAAAAILIVVLRYIVNLQVTSGITSKLVYAFVALNIAIVANTIISNANYIAYFGITENRIGVFLVCTLILCGLFATLAYLVSQRSFAWLVNANTWAWYTVVVVWALIPWDIFVAQSIIAKGVKRDVYLLYQLNNYATPTIIAHESQLKQRFASIKDYVPDAVEDSNGKHPVVSSAVQKLQSSNTNRSDFRDWKLADKWAEASLK